MSDIDDGADEEYQEQRFQPAPHALTRAQVEDRIDDICDDCIAEEAPGYVQELKDTDATLRQALAQLTEEMTALLEGKPLENGLYVHHPFCNGDRRNPAGTPGVTCSCKVVSREALTQQAQEVERLNNDVGMLRDEPARLKQQLAAMRAERDEAVESRRLFDREMNRMLEKLASILNKPRNEVGYENGLDQLAKQLAASQQKVRELEKVLETHGRNPTLWLEQYNRAESLQATLAARVAEVGELNVQLRDARQDAARLRELLAISKCGTCDGSGWYQDTDPMTGGPVQAQCRYCFNKSSWR